MIEIVVKFQGDPDNEKEVEARENELQEALDAQAVDYVDLGLK